MADKNSQKRTTKRVHIYEWECKDRKEHDYKVEFLAWGFDDKNEHVLLRFRDFEPMLTYAISENHKVCGLFIKELYKKLKVAFGHDNPTKVTIKNAKRLYYYTTKTSKILELRFNSIKKLWGCKTKLLNSLKVGHSNVKLIQCNNKITYINQFLSHNNLKSTEWFDVEVEKPKQKISRQKEYMADFTTICPANVSIISDPLILSWDIECYSHVPKSMPDSSHLDDVCFMISMVIQRLSQETSKKVILTLCEVNHREFDEVYLCKNEKELLLKFQTLIRDIDPTILIGYNIFGFDYKYISDRMNLHKMKWEKFGKSNDWVYIEKKKWESGSYGEQDISYLYIPGRISVDMLTVIRREYIFSKYSLNFVSNELLGNKKDDITPEQMFKIYKDYTKSQKNIEETTKVAKYCVQDSVLVMDLFKKTNFWVQAIQIAAIVGVRVVELYTRGQQIRCHSLLYTNALKKGYVLDYRVGGETDKYAGGAVIDPVPGLYNNVLCFDFSSLYPSLVIAYNICYTTLLKDEDVEKHEPDSYVEIDVEGYKKIYFLKKPKGLLPELMENLIKERRQIKKLIIKKKQEENVNDLELIVLDKKQLGLKTTANSIYGFLGTVKTGRLPLIEGAASITKLGRLSVHKLREYIEKKYDGNAIYGDTDSVMMTLKKITHSDQCQKWGDILAQKINGFGPQEIDLETGKVSKKGSEALFPPPMAIEFEKAMRLFAIKKKKYAAFFINSDGTLKKKGNFLYRMDKGIVMTRRDNCKLLKLYFDKILDGIMRYKKLKVIYKIIEEIFDFNNPNWKKIQNLSLTKTVKTTYKSKSCPMNILRERLVKKGAPPQANERLEYVITKVPQIEKKTLLGKKLRLLDELDEKTIDYVYYLSNMLKNPIDQIVQIRFEKPYENFVIKYKKKKFSVYRPIELGIFLKQHKISFVNVRKNFKDWSLFANMVEKIIN